MKQLLRSKEFSISIDLFDLKLKLDLFPDFTKRSNQLTECFHPLLVKESELVTRRSYLHLHKYFYSKACLKLLLLWVSC